MAFESCSTSPAERTTVERRAILVDAGRACLVPGIGTMSVPCASSPRQRHLGPGVQPLALAIASIAATIDRLRARLSAAKRGMTATAIAFGNIRGLLHGAGQQAAAERRIGHEGNAPKARRRLQRLLGILAIEQRVFALHGGDRVGLVRARSIVSGLASLKPNAFTLPRLHQVGPWQPTVSSIATLGSTRCW